MTSDSDVDAMPKFRTDGDTCRYRSAHPNMAGVSGATSAIEFRKVQVQVVVYACHVTTSELELFNSD